MSRGLGTRQRMLLTALRGLEAVHGARWFFVHGVIRAAWPDDEPLRARALRPGSDIEAEVNPSRILAGLAKRGLIERNARRGPGASIRLTAAGRVSKATPACK